MAKNKRPAPAPAPTTGMVTSTQFAADILRTGGFAPMSISFKARNGTALTLRVDVYRGFKAYWIESASGQCLTGHKFYNAGAVADILL